MIPEKMHRDFIVPLLKCESVSCFGHCSVVNALSLAGAGVRLIISKCGKFEIIGRGGRSPLYALSAHIGDILNVVQLIEIG